MNRFSVIETFHDYRLVDNVTGRSTGMGDGTDRDSWSQDALGSISAENFRQAWEDEANENTHEYFWAYFPDLYELEVWHDEDDWYVVIIEPWTKRATNALALTASFNVSQFCEAKPGPHLGHRVQFLNLPQRVQRHIAERLE